MDLIYYRTERGNFGDDLNKWLWPKIFGEEFLEKNNQSCLIGIGSILDNNSNLFNKTKTYKHKYIFGTGVRSINTNLKLDDSYKAIFFRGPLSSFKIEGNIDNYISDGAYAVALTDYYNEMKPTIKKYKVGFMPYFRSVDKVDWKKVCKENGWHFISPSSKNIEYILEDVAGCECIITEAMHGAIIADVFRVPWKRIKFYASIHESEAVSEFKWNDWLISIGIENNDFWELPYINSNVFPKRFFKVFFNKKQYILINDKLAEKFKTDNQFNLSSNEAYHSILTKLKKVISEFKDNY